MTATTPSSRFCLLVPLAAAALAASQLGRAGEQPWPEQKIVASDGAPGNNFGYSLAIFGDTAAVSSYQAVIDGQFAQGAVYVYDATGGIWSETQKLIASDGTAFAQFGEAVALDGETLLVSANGMDGFAGAVYVFTRTDAGWTETQKLTSSDAAGLDNFGWSVAISGTTALIGAPYADIDGASDQGAAYVFTNIEGTWTETGKLVASDGTTMDNFGRAVAIEGATLLVGSVNASVDDHVGQGADSGFELSGGVWSESQKLVASDGVEFDNFGQAVALSGTTALIGSPLAEKAYVFERDSTGWNEAATLAASDGPDASRYFGYALDLDGNRAVVGAFDADVDGNTFQGAAYVFDATDGGWTETQKLVASDGAAYENFGIAVGVSGRNVLAGAYYASVDGRPAQGAAYVYADPSSGGDTIFNDGFDGAAADPRNP